MKKQDPGDWDAVFTLDFIQFTSLQKGVGSMAKFAAVAAFAGLLGTSTAFAPTGVALRGSHAVPSISQRPQVGSGVLASRRLSVDAAGAGRRTSASFGALKMSANIEEEEDIEKIAFLEIPKNFDPKTKSMDEWFEQVRGEISL